MLHVALFRLNGKFSTENVQLMCSQKADENHYYDIQLCLVSLQQTNEILCTVLFSNPIQNFVEN